MNADIYHDARPRHIHGDPCFVIRDGKKLGAYLSRVSNSYVKGKTPATWVAPPLVSEDNTVAMG